MNDKEAVTPGNIGIGNEPEGGREGERKYSIGMKYLKCI